MVDGLSLLEPVDSLLAEQGTPPAWARGGDRGDAGDRADPAVTSAPRWRETRPTTPAGSSRTSPPSRRRSRSGLWNDIVVAGRGRRARARGGVRAGYSPITRLRATVTGLLGHMGIQSGRRPRWLSPPPAQENCPPRRAAIFAWAPLSRASCLGDPGRLSALLRDARHIAARAARAMLGAWLALTLALAARTFAVLLLFALSPSSASGSSPAAPRVARAAVDPRRRGGDADAPRTPALVASPGSLVWRRNPSARPAPGGLAPPVSASTPLDADPRRSLLAPPRPRPTSSSSSTVSAAPPRISCLGLSSSARVASFAALVLKPGWRPRSLLRRRPSRRRPGRRRDSRRRPSSHPRRQLSLVGNSSGASTRYAARFSSTRTRAPSGPSTGSFSQRDAHLAWVPSGTSVCSRRRCAQSSGPCSARRRGSFAGGRRTGRGGG